jgi:hypothetical protein
MSDNYFNYKPGLAAVGQYQMSGIPFATSSISVPAAINTTSPIVVNFPQVTKFVTVQNVAGDGLRVGFSALGVTGSENGGKNYYFTLTTGSVYTGEFRVSKIFLMGTTSAVTASVIAGLTGIPTGSIQNNWTGSIGV